VIVVPAGVFEPEDTNYFAALQLVGAAVYCAVILVRFDVGADGRLGSLVYYDGNDIGMLLVCTLPLCVYFARHASNAVYKLMSLGIALLFMYTIAKTGSRGAFLGLLAVGAYILLTFRTIQPSIRMGVVAVCAGLLVLVASTKFWSHMETLLNPTADYNWVGNDDQGRMSIWKRGIQYAEARPLTGVGVASFNIAEGTISPLARRQEYEKGLKWSSPHNSFIQVLAEMGLFGIVLFVAMLVVAFRAAVRLARASNRRNRKARRYGELARAHVAAIAGYSVAGFFLSQAYAPYLYFVFGMIIALDVTVRRAWKADDALLDSTTGSAESEARGVADAKTELGALAWS
jgi:O-antigen ligase